MNREAELLEAELRAICGKSARAIDELLAMLDFAQAACEFWSAYHKVLLNSVTMHTTPEVGKIIEDTADGLMRGRIASGEIKFPEPKEQKNA